MSALAVGSRRKPRAHAGHLWPVPVATPSDPAAADSAPITVSITIDGGDSADRQRVLAALRELIAAAGPNARAELHPPTSPASATEPALPAGGVSPAAALSAGAAPPGGAALPARAALPAGGASLAAAASPTLAISPAGAASPSGAPVAGGSPAAGVIRLDPRPRTVVRDGWPLHLSRLEYDLLLFMARHPRQVFSRTELLAQVWGHTHTTLRTVDVHVSRLRGKLEGQELITTVYGLGYRLADDAVVQVAG